MKAPAPEIPVMRTAAAHWPGIERVSHESRRRETMSGVFESSPCRWCRSVHRSPPLTLKLQAARDRVGSVAAVGGAAVVLHLEGEGGVKTLPFALATGVNQPARRDVGADALPSRHRHAVVGQRPRPARWSRAHRGQCVRGRIVGCRKAESATVSGSCRPRRRDASAATGRRISIHRRDHDTRVGARGAGRRCCLRRPHAGGALPPRVWSGAEAEPADDAAVQSGRRQARGWRRRRRAQRVGGRQRPTGMRRRWSSTAARCHVTCRRRMSPAIPLSAPGSASVTLPAMGAATVVPPFAGGILGWMSSHSRRRAQARY